MIDLTPEITARLEHLLRLVREHGANEAWCDPGVDPVLDFGYRAGTWDLSIVMPGHYAFEREGSDLDALVQDAVDYYGSATALYEKGCQWKHQMPVPTPPVLPLVTGIFRFSDEPPLQSWNPSPAVPQPVLPRPGGVVAAGEVPLAEWERRLLDGPPPGEVTVARGYRLVVEPSGEHFADGGLGASMRLERLT